MRLAVKAGALALTVLALSGCIKVTSTNEFSDHDTVSQELIVAFEPGAAEQLGVKPEELTAEALTSAGQALPGVDPTKVTIEDYVEGNLVGVRIVAVDLTLDELEKATAGAGALAGLSAPLTIVREGDEYVITVPASDDRNIDLPEDQLAMAASAVDVSMTFVFPGPVHSSTAGDFDGKKVVLGLEDLVAGDEIVIRGSAKNEIAWGPIMRWLGIGVVGVTIIGGALWLGIWDSRRRKRNNLPPIPEDVPGADS